MSMIDWAPPLKDVMFDVPQAAKELGVSKQTIYRWINEGKLPVQKIGNVILIDRRNLFYLEDKRIAEQVLKNVIRKLVAEVREYAYGECEVEFLGYRQDRTFRFSLAEMSVELPDFVKPKQEVMIQIGKIEVDIEEDEPGIGVEIKKITVDGRDFDKEEIKKGKWI